MLTFRFIVITIYILSQKGYFFYTLRKNDKKNCTVHKQIKGLTQ